ncbi:MAG: hypothetical protein K9G58_14910 [Bacteroidales bacterium]|nr:hypothetical protein [Bacteroidales bacterium]MCF8388835.1 hypothetical protein [Bacteroidales bacterium]MCF8399461.1 hypothetical protein [Bacteroidales bacterium]
MNFFTKIPGFLLIFFIAFSASSQNVPRDKNNAPNKQHSSFSSDFQQPIGFSQPDQQMGIAGILKYRSDLGKEGSMYLNDAWKEGTLILKDNSEIKDWKFRYNVRYQEMQFINKDDDTLALGEPGEIKYLNFDKKVFVVEEFEKDDVISEGYFELVMEGENKILSRREITHHVMDPTNDDPEDDTYIHNSTYYLKLGDQPAVPVLMNKKCFYHVFEDHKDKVKEFIKENRIKCKSVDDLVKVIAFYESL